MEKKEYKEPSIKVRKIYVEDAILAASVKLGGNIPDLEMGEGTPPPVGDAKKNIFIFDDDEEASDVIHWED